MPPRFRSAHDWFRSPGAGCLIQWPALFRIGSGLVPCAASTELKIRMLILSSCLTVVGSLSAACKEMQYPGGGHLKC